MTDQKPREMLLELHELELKTTTQSRETIDQETVERYGELMRQGVKFDPIVVYFDGARYWRADGWHRSAAAEWAGKKSIAALVYEGTEEDATVYACGANARHGKAMSNADKRKCVATLVRLRGEWSDRAIADYVGCGHPFVAKIRGEVESDSTSAAPSLSEQLKRLGRDGKAYPATQPQRTQSETGPAVADFLEDDDLEEALEEAESNETDLIDQIAAPYREAQRLLSRVGALMKAEAEDPVMGAVIRDKITRITTEIQGVRACVRQAEWVGRCGCGSGCSRCRRTGYVWRALVQVEGPEA